MNHFSEILYPNIKNEERDIIKLAVDTRLEYAPEWENLAKRVHYELSYKRPYFDRKSASFINGCLKNYIAEMDEKDTYSAKAISKAAANLLDRFDYFTQDLEVFNEDEDL